MNSAGKAAAAVRGGSDAPGRAKVEEKHAEGEHGAKHGAALKEGNLVAIIRIGSQYGKTAVLTNPD